MAQLILTLGPIGGAFAYLRNLVHWPPQGTSDAGELIVVVTTLAVSMGIMVAFGQWWQR